jgi:hypothetical protein
VALQVGRIVSNLYQTIIYFEAGPDAFADCIVEGDTSLLAALYAALAECGGDNQQFSYAYSFASSRKEVFW